MVSRFALSIVLLLPTSCLAFTHQSRSTSTDSFTRESVCRYVAGIDRDTTIGKKPDGKNAFGQADFLQKRMPSSWSEALDIDVAAAAAGGAMLGAGLGLAAAIAQPDLAVDPAVTAAVASSAALAASVQQENEAARTITKTALANPVKGMGKFVVEKFQNALEKTKRSILSIPERIANAIQRQIEQTKADILSLPERIMEFLRGKMEEAVQEVQNLPQKMADAANAAAEEMALEMQRKSQEAVAEFQAMPSKMADAAKQSAQRKAMEVQQSVEASIEEAKSFPGRKRDEIMALFSSDDKPSSSTMTPKPPTIPPTM